jgi:hypothetical protein
MLSGDCHEIGVVHIQIGPNPAERTALVNLKPAISYPMEKPDDFIGTVAPRLTAYIVDLH